MQADIFSQLLTEVFSQTNFLLRNFAHRDSMQN